MKVSQLTKRMSRGDDIVIKTPARKILYEGAVKDFAKDNPCNSMFVLELGTNRNATFIITVDDLDIPE